MAGPPDGGKKIVFSLVLLGLLWGLAELACLAGLWALGKYKHLEYSPQLVRTLSEKHRGILDAYLAGRPSYLAFSPPLGWSIRPHGTSELYHANGQGLRADREYDPAPPPGRVRVAAFGDSFTHSSDVADPFAWEVALEQLEPRLEVMNFGVPGYGDDQAYLRYQMEGERFHPQIVLIGFMSDDINRVVSVYRPFYFYASGLPLTKPRFVTRGGSLSLIENPIQNLQGYRELLDHPDAKLEELGEHDFFYQRRHQRSRFDFLPSVRFLHVIRQQYTEPILKGSSYNTRSEAYQVQAGLFSAFYREALAHGALPILVFFPEKRDIRIFRDGGGKVYQPFLADAERQGRRHVDLLEGFERYAKDNKPQELAHVHYTQYGYHIAAQWLLDYLRANGLTTPEGVQAAVAAERARVGLKGES